MQVESNQNDVHEQEVQSKNKLQYLSDIASIKNCYISGDSFLYRIYFSRSRASSDSYVSERNAKEIFTTDFERSKDDESCRLENVYCEKYFEIIDKRIKPVLKLL